jgi:glycyl-tRNA synthetase
MESDQLVSFLAQKGFVWGPEPEIYGGLSGFYTYAPLGKLLKNNVENSIRSFLQKNNFWEVECPTIMQTKVWEASGHLKGFADDAITCSKCNSSFKVETLLKEKPEGKNVLEILKKEHIVCPNCKGHFKDTITKQNLMMKTVVGIDTEAYLRPETATTTYLPFIRYVDFFRKKLPFGVFQIGKAYRNEISPRQHILRMREFTQAEAQFFIFPDQKKNFDISKIEDVEMNFLSNKTKKVEKLTIKDALHTHYLKNPAYAWTLYVAYHLFKNLGFKDSHIRLNQHAEEDLAFYADDAWDLEIKTESFGWFECVGIHDRTDYDVKQHEKFSGKSFEAMNEANEKKHPHVLEIAFGTDRPVFCLLDNFMEIQEKGEGKTIFKIAPSLSPIKVAVLPLVNKEKLPEIGLKLFEELQNDFVCNYDSSGSIGKRYLREAEKGTALCVTIDFETVEKNTVTLRERDSEKQVRIPLQEVKAKVQAYLSGEPFEKLGEKIS